MQQRVAFPAQSLWGPIHFFKLTEVSFPGQGRQWRFVAYPDKKNLLSKPLKSHSSQINIVFRVVNDIFTSLFIGYWQKTSNTSESAEPMRSPGSCTKKASETAAGDRHRCMGTWEWEFSAQIVVVVWANPIWPIFGEAGEIPISLFNIEVMVWPSFEETDRSAGEKSLLNNCKANHGLSLIFRLLAESENAYRGWCILRRRP